MGSQAADELRPHEVEINAMVAGGRLDMEWTFSRSRHRPETVRRWAERCADLLREIAESSRRGLEERVPDLVEVYPLTPLQEGMLFHTLAEAEHGAYVNQLVLELGDEVDLRLLEDSWQELAARRGTLGRMKCHGVRITGARGTLPY